MLKLTTVVKKISIFWRESIWQAEPHACHVLSPYFLAQFILLS
jgi:hypothetical protein